MNTIITSKGDITGAALQLAAEEGLNAINIRAVARRADISVGAIYAYYPNKSLLVSATVRRIWADIFYQTSQQANCDSIATYIQGIFVSLQKRGEEYRDFFLSQGSGFATGGREVSHNTVDFCLMRMGRSLAKTLNKDHRIREDAFDNTFTKEDLARFIFTSTLTMLARGDNDCSLLIRVVERALY